MVPRRQGQKIIVDVLDGAMIIIAMYIMNIAHPALLLDTNLSEFADAIRYLGARIFQ